MAVLNSTGRLLLGGCAAAACSLALAAPAGAATIAPTVTTDDIADNGNCTLREAIQATNTDADVDLCDHDLLAGEDTINLSAMEFDLTLTGAEDANQTGDLDVEAGTGGLRIVGTAGSTEINGSGFVTLDRILHVESGALEVEGVTFTGGFAQGSPGGAILTQSNASLELTDSIVTDNGSGGAGGGLQVNGSGGATITNSTIDANSADEGGSGGIGASAPLTIIDSTIAGNGVNGTAPVISGGGISFAPSSAAALTITDSLIDGNNATGTQATRGGGVNVEGSTPTVNISSTVISNNDAVANGVGATSGGGGLRFGASTQVTISDSVIAGNTSTVSDAAADNVGGGVFNLGNTEIQRSTISGNSLASGAQSGGGIQDESSLVLVNSTVANNTALAGGGAGLSAAGTTTSIFNSTFSGNNATTGDALQQSAGALGLRGSIVDNAAAADACAGTITSSGFNFAVGSSCALAATGDAQNQMPLLEAFDDWGGPDVGPTGNTEPLMTQPPQPVSNAIDHIPTSPTNNCTDDVAAPLAVDERGFPRPVDGFGDSTLECDAGAIEVYPCAGSNATQIGTAAGESILGSAGDDVIDGLGGNDTINGASGADTLCGGDGNDTFAGDDTTAADTFRGGNGITDTGTGDEVSYASAAGDISVNLASGVSFGTGNDDFDPSIENLRGGIGQNSFVGDAGNNDLRGGGGDDVLAGGDGNDLLDGQADGAFGGDGVSYSIAPVAATAPITASLQSGTATGQGTDTLVGLEKLRGGPFADNLTGDAGVNVVEGTTGNDTITGLGGADDLQGEGNDDSIFARDGVQDDVDCGAGTMDTVEADQVGIDLIDASCEAGGISFFVPPPPPPPLVATPPITPTPPATPAKKKCKKKKKGKKTAAAAKKCKKKKKKK